MYGANKCLPIKLAQERISIPPSYLQTTNFTVFDFETYEGDLPEDVRQKQTEKNGQKGPTQSSFASECGCEQYSSRVSKTALFSKLGPEQHKPFYRKVLVVLGMSGKQTLQATKS